MAAETNRWALQLQGMPAECRYVPLNHDKTPIDPANGYPRKRWEDFVYTVDELAAFNGTVQAIGLMLGPKSGGIATIDFDGLGSENTFNLHFGRPVEELPMTATWSSGRPGHYQMAYRVPGEYWDLLSGKKLELEDHAHFELRWDHQSGIAGVHPNWLDPKNKKGFNQGDGDGFYSFVNPPSAYPIADAPKWFLEGWEKICGGRARKVKKARVGSFFSEKTLKNLARADAIQDAAKAREILTQWLQPPSEYQDYKTWCDVGMILNLVSREYGDEWHLFPEWDRWSSQQDNYDGTDALRSKWESFQRESGELTAGMGTLVRMAEEAGYKVPSFQQQLEKLPPDEKKEVQAAVKEDGALAIRDIYAELYELEKRGITEEFHKRAYQRSLLGARQMRKEDVDRRLLLMLAEEHQLLIGEHQVDEGKLRHRDLTTPTTKAGELTELLPGFLFVGKDALINGAAGSGKTLLAAAMSYAVATGDCLLDMEHGTPFELQGPTLWIGTDGGDGAHEMLKAYSTKLNPPSWSKWNQNITFWGADADTGESPWALNVAGLDRLCRELEQGHPNGKPYALVVIDTLKAVTDLADVSYAKGTMGTVMRTLQALGSKYGTAVVWNHHPTKGANTKSPGIDTSGGNSNIYEIPYVVHRLVKADRDGHQHVTRMVVDKYRDGRGKARKFDYVVDEEVGLFKILPPEVGTESSVLEEIWSRGPGGISARELAKILGIGESTLYRKWLTPLKKDGLLKAVRATFFLSQAGANKLAEARPELAEEIAQRFAKRGAP